MARGAILPSRPKPRVFTKTWQFWEGAVRVMGPAFLVSVSHVDPGDWATAVEGGSRFGMKLVWVVVVSHLIAIHLQNLAARLGLVTGKHLAQVCRQNYPRLVCCLLWFLSEVSIVALDLTMVLGTALGLSLLLRVPVLPCILLSGLDTLVLVLLPQLGMRRAEQLTVGLMALIVLCFLVEIFIVKPPVAAVASGLYPSLDRESLYTVVSLLGANVMPHNFYLHSALVAGRAGRGGPVALLCHYNFIDIAVALGIALLVNVAVTVIAAQTFHAHGIIVLTLQDAHDMMEQILSSAIAPAAFGLALLCAGQLSTFTGTISGQVVLQGFLNIKLPTWQRRLITRSAAVIPAALLQYLYGDQGTFQLLVMMQVVLALALPFTLVPLIKATSSQQLMGKLASSRTSSLLSWAACSIIFGANLLLLLHWLFPDEDDEADILDMAVALASEQPLRLLGVVVLVVLASAALALLVWMICTPFGGDFHDELQLEKPAPMHLLHMPAAGDVEDMGGIDRKPSKARLKASDEELEKIFTPEEPQAVPPRKETMAVDSWEASADDLLSKDVSEIRKDLQQAYVPVPGPVLAADSCDGWEEESLAGVRGPNQLGALHQDASTSSPSRRDGHYELSQGARREVAHAIANLWSAFYDLHGRANSASELAAILDNLAIDAQLFPITSLHHEQLPPLRSRHPAIARVRQLFSSIANVPGGESLLQPQTGGDLLLSEQIVAELWSPDRATRDVSSETMAGPLTPASEEEVLILLHCGLWCIVRLLELSRQEPRPELWGRYALGLNRLQGVLRVANLAVNAPQIATQLQLLVKEVEASLSSRKGPAGTSAGHVAFPKGKEIIFSVLKRYRRALLPPEPNAGARVRPGPAVSTFLLLALAGCISLAAVGSGGSSSLDVYTAQMI